MEEAQPISEDVQMIETAERQPENGGSASSIPLSYVLLKTESAKDAGLDIESNGLRLTA